MHLATGAAQRRRREHAFRRAARAEIDVDAGLFRVRGVDDAGDVAVADQPDRRAGRAHRLDQLGMARPVENAGGDVGQGDALGLGKPGDVLGRRRVNVDDIFGIAGTDGDLVHVDVRREQQAALFRDGNDGERVGQVLGADRGAFERIERDIHARAPAGADFLADVEHRRLVALPLADDHGALDGEPVELLAHGVDGNLVRRLLVAAPAQPGGGHGGAFGDAHQFHRQDPVETGGRVMSDIHRWESSLTGRLPPEAGLFCQTCMTTARPDDAFIEKAEISID